MKRSASWSALALGSSLLAGALAGCATPPDAGAPREIRTASDTTDNERRARVRMELASAYFGRGQMSTALDETKLALAAKPDLPEAYNLQGLIYGGLGEPRLAEESFKRALQLAPRDADTMQNYGWFLCQQSRFAESDAQFENALSQPQYRGTSRTLLAQGVCQSRTGDLARAERTLMRSYEIDPTNPSTAYSLSDLMFRRGDYERARFYIGRVNAQAAATNAQSLWLAARIEHRLGNQAGAQALGRQVRDRFPQSTEAMQFERGRLDE